jgi:hypothetical protein
MARDDEGGAVWEEEVGKEGVATEEGDASAGGGTGAERTAARSRRSRPCGERNEVVRVGVRGEKKALV